MLPFIAFLYFYIFLMPPISKAEEVKKTHIHTKMLLLHDVILRIMKRKKLKRSRKR
jgi:hypothetical protein